jgi:hypothetical protein
MWQYLHGEQRAEREMYPGFGSQEVCLDFSDHCHDWKEWNPSSDSYVMGTGGSSPRAGGGGSAKLLLLCRTTRLRPKEGGMLEQQQGAQSCQLKLTLWSQLDASTPLINPILSQLDPFHNHVTFASKTHFNRGLWSSLSLQMSLFPNDLHQASRCGS